VSDVRLAEVLAALSLAGDLGHGRSLEYSLRVTYLSCRLAEEARLPAAERRDVLYSGLLHAAGCVGNAHEIAAQGRVDDIAFKSEIALANLLEPADQLKVVIRHFGDAGPAALRPIAVARALADPDGARRNTLAHCETGSLVARRCGLGEGVAAGLYGVFERWDGRGRPAGLRRAAIPLVARVVAVGSAAELLRASHGDDAVAEGIRRIAGRALDPDLAAVFLALEQRGALWSALDAPTLWDDVLAFEPGPRTIIGPSELDDIALAFADFADVKSPFFVGHSRGVARLAVAAAHTLRMGDDEIEQIRRAALLHDVGRASVPNAVLDKPRALTPGERERVRLHSYYTERVLERAPSFAACAPAAGAHHERLDGSGYHRGAKGPSLPLAARLLAAADTFQAMTERRAHRAGRTVEQAVALVRVEQSAGRLDVDAVEAVIAAAGVAPRRMRATSTLTDRERQIVRLLAAGHSNKEIASQLDISESTTRHHLESIYSKLGVATRTGAVMQALTSGLL
jgi:HD-GYP domain-containing protein (c-di-GMP phosphodiesterase class II)